MDTTALKSFATSARAELISEVGARITAVLSKSSHERVEKPRAVTALERAIAEAGGGDEGKAHVAEKVAYTWFNRIIALRFMDANGYTGIGIVSPAADQVGQPEILAAAKRGQIDVDVVKGANATTVMGLLNGTRQPRPGVEAQAEAYTLLLADYCRYWNRAMPFMFEREGDFTELLIPANLLAEDSALSRSVEALTQEVCQDVEVIGWLYQYYISERKDEVFAGFKKNKKAGADEIPAATQLFTPHWIVRYLVENSVGRLWMLNHPESRIVDQMDYYIAPVDEETDFLKITKPEELTVIDPACGSGHMLTYAFDLLYSIYEEEGYTPSQIPGLILTNNLFGTEIDPRAGALAAFALTMKAVAKRKLFLKNPVQLNVCVLEPISFTSEELSYLVTEDGDLSAEETFWNQFAEADTFGSLIQPDPTLIFRLADRLARLDAEGDIFRDDVIGRATWAIRKAQFLTPRYAVVVANPPYMGSKNMNDDFATWAENTYPKTRYDLFAMFIERSLEFIRPGGVAAMVTMQSWMFLSRFGGFRTDLLRRFAIQNMAHLGTRAFESIGGEVVQVTATCIGKEHKESKGTYLRLSEISSPAEKAYAIREVSQQGISEVAFVNDQRKFLEIPGAPIAYWAADALLETFESGKRIEDLAPVRQGFQTGDNDRFMRFWFEVSRERIYFDARSTDEFHDSGARFAPYLKGGSFRKWYGNDEYVVLFDPDSYALLGKSGNKLPSRSLYFHDSITWSALSSGDFGARYAGTGSTFSAKGACAFPTDVAARDLVMAVFNSSVAGELLEFMGATLDFNVGSLREIPLPVEISDESAHELHDDVTELITIHRDDWNTNESSPGFTVNSLVNQYSGAPLNVEASRAVQCAVDANDRVVVLQARLDRLVSSLYGLSSGPQMAVTLRFDTNADPETATATRTQLIQDLVSYAVGCMFGRYSLDEPGLILADQGAKLQDYLAKLPSPKPTFSPDADSVIPILQGDWFEGDIVEQFHQFLRAAFGEQYFNENLQFVTKSLGVKHLRDYFVKSFYKDHCKRYKNRPIYWLFSSPKGSFNALIYMHRYASSTVSTVLTYLREYVTKLESALQQAELAANAKEADRLRKILVELNEYEHATLFPKASENIVIDLDDGVKANYPKFGDALKKITGLEKASD